MATLLLLAGFHVLRLLASACAGPACDAYVPFSLLLPLLLLGGETVTALAARAELQRRPWSRWNAALAVAAVAGVGGPILVLAVFRNNPDPLVVISTILFAALPVTALAYSFRVGG